MKLEGYKVADNSLHLDKHGIAADFAILPDLRHVLAAQAAGFNVEKISLTSGSKKDTHLHLELPVRHSPTPLEPNYFAASFVPAQVRMPSFKLFPGMKSIESTASETLQRYINNVPQSTVEGNKVTLTFTKDEIPAEQRDTVAKIINEKLKSKELVISAFKADGTKYTVDNAGIRFASLDLDIPAMPGVLAYELAGKGIERKAFILPTDGVVARGVVLRGPSSVVTSEVELAYTGHSQELGIH